MFPGAVNYSCCCYKCPVKSKIDPCHRFFFCNSCSAPLFVQRQLFPKPYWPIKGARQATNQRRALLCSANRGLATTDCSSLQLREGEVVLAIHYSVCICIITPLRFGTGGFLSFALRTFGRLHIRISGRGRRRTDAAAAGQVGLN